ncbi:MAG TPA: vitamin K epoxide reductase family protein [Candidatus Nanoarchaeia archaeon]|nr:vitamin K epoxide reductase family protein [Candidatus Nanoarchaeia archaeon]
MRNIEKQRTILWILTIIMLFNVFVSAYIGIEKAALLRGESNDICFASTGPSGGCGDVQLSDYGVILGVSVPTWGIVCFSFMAIMLASLAYSMHHRTPISEEKDIESTVQLVGICFVIGALGAAYFIILQFFVIESICKYCMIIDSLTIISTIVYFATFKKGADFYSI